ncbi:MAG: hypothetical protein ABI609_04265 [Acidobacteriota bacterium]
MNERAIADDMHYAMHVIGDHNELGCAQPHVGPSGSGRTPLLANDFAAGVQRHRSIADLAENVASLVAANRHKIRAG